MDIRLKSTLVTMAIIVFIVLFLYAVSTFEIFATIFFVAFYIFLMVVLLYLGSVWKVDTRFEQG